MLPVDKNDARMQLLCASFRIRRERRGRDKQAFGRALN
jgi:hypothetical protein